jgi:AcrR family transcriptional regulator
MRGIAAAAGVDPALVVHHFGAKEELFKAVMTVPADVAERFAALAEGPRETVGRRFAELVAALVELPEVRAVLVGRVRAAVDEPEAARLVRELVSEDLGRVARAVNDDRPELRAALVGTQVVGMAFARAVVGIEPLPRLSSAELVELLGPTFQRYFTGPLD